MNSHASLESDCRRTTAGGSSPFSSVFAINGSNYDAGLFLRGVPSPTHDQVTGLESDDDDRLFVLWSSGSRLFVGRMAGAIIRAIRRNNCMYLHWRNDQDDTVQEATFPLTVAT